MPCLAGETGTMRNTLRALSCVAVVVSVAASCGESTTPADTTAVASTLPSDVPTSLTITVGTAGEPALATATLEIAADGTASGTGFLAAPQRAADAAVLLENPAAVKRLKEGPPPGQACTEIYGGPDTATVRGTFQGGAVEQDFHRSNGCGISDWELFVPLLGRSRWDGEHRVYFREESSIPVAVGTMFTIELDSNATTGYQWQMLPLDGGTVTAGPRTYLEPGGSVVGRGGWDRFPFTANAVGTATITFEYRRSFEPATTPAADTVTFTVQVTA